MPIATPEVYADMISRAKEGGFAYPAINCTSSETVNAALRGFADAGSDGIIQFSTGGAEFASGTKVKDMVTGAVALAEFAHVVAEKYPVNVALHTDHCPKDKLDGYVRPLIALSQDRVNAGQEPLFQSHMWDGSAIELDENLQIAEELHREVPPRPRSCSSSRSASSAARRTASPTRSTRSSTPRPGDFVATAKALGLGEKGIYLLAATFGNVHGVYKPGNVKLRPEILKQGQDVVAKEFGLSEDKPFNLVFHGGSGSAQSEIREALSYGVVKMNVDTDTQYAFTRPIVGPHVQQLRRRAEDRRRGRQQEGLRPAQLPQGRRDRAWPRASQQACEDLLSAASRRPPA